MQAGEVEDGALADAAAVDDAFRGADDAALEVLKQELAKWQERVPKLAAALRERTDQADRLQAEVDKLVSPGSSTSAGGHEAGIQAREHLIDELEAKLKALDSRHQDLEGQLRSRDMEIANLQSDVAAWNDKWQAATSSLDEQGSLASAREEALQRLQSDFNELNAALEENTRTSEDRDHELAMLRDESASLNERNAKLFETIELANHQIEALGESLVQLRDQVREKDGRLHNAACELQSLQERLAAHDDQMLCRDADMETVLRRLEIKTEELNNLKARQTDHEELVAERESLQQQIGKLRQQDQTREQDLETLHRRIESMQEQADNLKSKINESDEQLVGLDALRESEARLQTELAQRVEEIDRLTERMVALDQLRSEHESGQALLAGKDAELAKLAQSVAKLQGEARGLEARVAEEHGEVDRLEQCIANADQITNDREDERRQLSGQLCEIQERYEHLTAQLNERSNLVMDLEQEKTSAENAAREVSKQNEQLSGALAKAERHASEHAEHIIQLDSRLEIQKEYMLKLDQELAQTHEEHAAVHKDRNKALAEKDKQISGLKKELEVNRRIVEDVEPADDAAHEELVAKMQKLEAKLERRTLATEKAEEAIQELEKKLTETKAAARSESGDRNSQEAKVIQKEVHKLEQMVRNRTEQLNKMQWQQNMAERTDVANMDSDNKMLIVLNQQLTDARESNKRLVAQVQALEAQLASGACATTADDLTAIKGIGPKVAGQLVELGISSYLQIAELEEEDLADEAHLLNGFRGRIRNDDWISQARGLVQG